MIYYDVCSSTAISTCTYTKSEPDTNRVRWNPLLNAWEQWARAQSVFLLCGCPVSVTVKPYVGVNTVGDVCHYMNDSSVCSVCYGNIVTGSYKRDGETSEQRRIRALMSDDPALERESPRAVWNYDARLWGQCVPRHDYWLLCVHFHLIYGR